MQRGWITPRFRCYFGNVFSKDKLSIDDEEVVIYTAAEFEAREAVVTAARLHSEVKSLSSLYELEDAIEALDALEGEG